MDEVAESVAAHFEIAVLVKRSARGREEDDRLTGRRRLRIARSRRQCLAERACDLMHDVGAERSRKLFGSFTDQIRFADARKEAPQRLDAAGLWLAAGDPEYVAEASERLGRRIGVGCFGIVDEEHGAAPADFLH